jgi:hypothetical protein
MRTIRAAASTLRLLRLAIANLIGYPPVLERSLGLRGRG